MAIDFLYLSEKDMIEAGVLDAKGCVEAMRDVMSLFGKGDFLLGGPKNDEHGLQINFPKARDIEGFPLDNGPDRRFNAMPAYLGGRFHMAGQKWYGSNHENISKGLPRSILMLTLNDVDTGAPVSYMSANLLSAMRTGAMPAMAADYLANKDSEILTILGPGVINHCALACYLAVLPNIKTVKIKGSSPTSKSTLAFKAYIEKEFPQIENIIICDSLEEACRDSDVISEAMSVSLDKCEEFKMDWFKKGATVFSMGSFLWRDFDSLLGVKMVVDNYGMYDKYMNNFIARGPVDELGNKREWVIMGIHFIHLVREGKVRREAVLNLCDIVNNKVKGRTDKDEIIMCSSGGMPIEDVAWGYDCYMKAKEKKIGTWLNLWDEPYLY